jgi:hypothetical protein
MKRAAKTRRNMWPFSSSKKAVAPKKRPRKRSGLTVGQSSQAAYKAGQKAGDTYLFDSWLESKGLEGRGNALIDRLRKAYERGVMAGEKKEDRRTATKAKAAVKSAEQKGYVYVPSTDAIQDAYKQGAKTLKEALEMAGAQKNPSKFDRCVKDVKRKGKGMNAYAVCTAAGTRKKRKRNPADEAIAGYQDFHGRPPEEFVTVERKVHFHSNLSGAGELKRLVVIPEDGKRVVTLTKFKRAILAFNERGNQLFIEGGDQSVNLADFGIDPEKYHENETLGKVKKIDYFTTKDHLGSEGGTATYQHTFRTTNEDGRHVTIRIARYPDLIYRVLEQHLEFSGGSYEILPEGIDR